jgi:Major Facilitator Superfamily
VGSPAMQRSSGPRLCVGGQSAGRPHRGFMQTRHRGPLELASLMEQSDGLADEQQSVHAVRQQSTAESGIVTTQAPPPSSWQWILALCTAAIFICYADRSNISVAILEMSKDFNWDESYQGTILSIFFLGYAATQLVGGTLADRYGGKAVLAVGVVTWSAFTFLTPDAAMAGSATLITCRICMGLGEVRALTLALYRCAMSPACSERHAWST